MRQLAALLSMLIALSATAAEMWRWKDADGVVHYSDRPVPGAERMTVLSSQKTTGGDKPQASGPTAAPAAEQPAAAEFKYTRCAVETPTDEQVFNNVNAVEVSLALEPQLQPGHRLQVLLNGLVNTEWPPGVMARTLNNMYRGSYMLSMRVVDANGRAQCTSATIDFHVRQASLLAPGRRPPAKKP